MRYTNAHWLVVQDPDAADDGLFVRDADGQPMCFDAKDRCALRSANDADASPKTCGRDRPAGWPHGPACSFDLMVNRFLGAASFRPMKCRREPGLPAATVKRIAAELAEVAFENTVELDIAWTDWAGRRHDKMVGRPVSMHAMRGISAHSNGFHTCRLIHLLQMLLGSIDVPGGFRYKPPFPKPCPAGPAPAGKDAKPMTPLGGMPLGFPSGPDDLAGQPGRIAKDV